MAPSSHDDAIRLQGVGRAVRRRASCSTSPCARRGAASTRSRVSDHFQPWRHNGGHAPDVAGVARRAAARRPSAVRWARACSRRRCATTRRSSPRRSRRSAASRPGRIFLGVGTGEAMNETPATGGEFAGRQGAPAADGRGDRAHPAACGPRSASTSRASTTRTERATIYDRPDEPVPIYVAASGPAGGQARRPRRRRLHLHQRQGPELYVELLANVAEGAEKAGRDQRRSSA